MQYQLPLAAIFVSATLSFAQQPPTPPVTSPVKAPNATTPALTPAQAPPPVVADDAVVLTIGTEKITKAQFDAILATLPDQQRAQASTPAGRKRLAESLADMKVLDQEAHDRKIDQTPKVQTLMKLQADQVLAQNLYQALADGAKVDDAMVKSYYDTHKQEWDEVKAKHILIRFKGSPVPVRTGAKDLTEEEALAKITEIRGKIVAGGNFSDLAKAESDDTGSAKEGGDLGPAFPHGRMVPQFEQAAFAAKVGEVTEPVKSQFGYHIIVVESHETKTMEQARPEIEAKLKPQAAQQQAQAALIELRKKKSIVFDESYFGK